MGSWVLGWMERGEATLFCNRKACLLDMAVGICQQKTECWAEV